MALLEPFSSNCLWEETCCWASAAAGNRWLLLESSRPPPCTVKLSLNNLTALFSYDYCLLAGENSVLWGSQGGSVELLLLLSVFREHVFYLPVEMPACSCPLPKKNQKTISNICILSCCSSWQPWKHICFRKDTDVPTTEQWLSVGVSMWTLEGVFAFAAAWRCAPEQSLQHPPFCCQHWSKIGNEPLVYLSLALFNPIIILVSNSFQLLSPAWDKCPTMAGCVVGRITGNGQEIVFGDLWTFTS